VFDPGVVVATAKALTRMEEIRLSQDEILESHVRDDSWGVADNHEDNLLCLERGEGDIYGYWTDAGIEAFTNVGRGATFIVDTSEDTPRVLRTPYENPPVERSFDIGT